jgi:hypothetical protein
MRHAGVHAGQRHGARARPHDCSAYYHPGTTITVRAGLHITGAPHQPPWCLSDFAGFSGPPGCSGMGTCDAAACSCTFTAGSGEQQVTISFSA